MVELKKVIEFVVISGVVDDIENFDPNKTFKENGIDSLDVMSLFLAIEEGLNVKFSEEEANEISTVNQMLEALNSRKI